MLFDSLPERVTIYEVSPRDGLQNEPVIVATEGKAQLVTALADAGVARIEVTSFVSPKWIPQLADAEQLLSLLPPAHARYSALCPNLRGLARVRATALGEIVVFVSASEEHNQMNLNDTIAHTLARLREVVGEAKAQGLSVRGCISTLWGFRREGDVALGPALRIGQQLVAMGCRELSLADTMGLATPLRTRDVVQAFLSEHPRERLSMHMHDTRGTALANVLVGLELGIRIFEASVGGLGGCPFAPGAAGNLATEDLVYMLHGMGIETGIALDKLVQASKAAAALVGRSLPAKLQRAWSQPGDKPFS